jgi:PPM family protein phosphatase
MRLRVGARTDTGRVRAMNEDVYIARADQGLFVVCDGMGGAPAGEVASGIAANTIVRHLNGGLDVAVGAASAERYRPQTKRLVDAMRRSNEVIYRQSKNNPRQAEMGTTAVSAWIMERIASVAHVGDSRAYLWYDNRLERLTSDHVLAGSNADTRSENVLLRVLGRAPDVDVEVSEVPLQPGDYLLLCSDGLTRMVAECALAEAIAQLREPQRICDYLVDAANRCGGADNITVVVVQVMGQWWQRRRTRCRA